MKKSFWPVIYPSQFAASAFLGAIALLPAVVLAVDWWERTIELLLLVGFCYFGHRLVLSGRGRELRHPIVPAVILFVLSIVLLWYHAAQSGQKLVLSDPILRWGRLFRWRRFLD
jgi:hypothetical protein